MIAGSFLVGNPEGDLYDRMAARVEVSTEDADNFRKNLVTVLAEERIGLAVKAPIALPMESTAPRLLTWRPKRRRTPLGAHSLRLQGAAARF